MPQTASGQSYYRETKLPVSSDNLDEDAPVLFENVLIFSSNRPQNSIVSKTDADKRLFFHRYSATYDADWQKMGAPKEFAPELASDLHDGPVTFTPDESTMCYTRMYEADNSSADRNSNGYSGLYFADYDGEKWINIREFEFNDPEVNFFSPCFSRDGRRLFFAANFPDSNGGLDLYVSEKVNGQWTTPVNLGNQVNTPQNDFYPYAHSSGRLYFCSEGHDNRGGKDIFMTEQVNGRWLPPQKLGDPFNSASEDYSLVMSDDFQSGFFVSARRGSKDIFHFYSDLPEFENPREQQLNEFCYLLKENSADTADHSLYDYSWLINDTLTLKGREVDYCFPGPGLYDLRFNVYNKLTDSLMENQASYQLFLEDIIQAYITCPDTGYVGLELRFDARKTNLPGFEIDSYFWDFGDGQRAEGIETRHTYLFPGKYKVILGVTEKVANRKDTPLKKANFKQIVIIPPN